jgi:hypothetical protein
MGFFVLVFLYISLVVGLVARDTGIVSYDGYQVYRVNTGNQASAVKAKLSGLTFETWNDDSKHMDIVLPPDEIAAFKALGLKTYLMHSDLGKSIATEALSKSTRKRAVNNLSWYDSYQTYEDRVEYFNDLHASFPRNF